MQKYLRWNADTQHYQKSGKVPLDRLTNGFTVRNDGNSNVVVNGETLPPGAFKAIGGNYGEIYAGRLDINFNITGIMPAPNPVINDAVVTNKYYMPGQGFDDIL